MIPFSHSEQSSLGVEWEVALADRESGDLVSAAEELLTALGTAHPEFIEPEGLAPQITREFLANTLEAVTGVCGTVSEAVDQLSSLASAMREVADPLGIDLFSAGTHPYAKWQEQPVSDKDRYRKVLDRTQYWGRQMLVYGVHVHVGLDARDKVWPAMNQLVNYYPHFLALTANSPFWEGVDTGYASQRAMVFQQLPASGVPYQFEKWADYEDYIDGLIRTGMIAEESENRWDIRPVARFGTVEVRVCDGLATLEEIAAVTALTQCVVEEVSRIIDDGGRIPTLPRWFAAENKWRASRYGLDAEIITGAHGTVGPVREHTAELVERLEPIARDLGCAAELAGVSRILERGPGYVRQRRVHAENGGELRPVVRDIVELNRYGYEPA